MDDLTPTPDETESAAPLTSPVVDDPQLRVAQETLLDLITKMGFTASVAPSWTAPDEEDGTRSILLDVQGRDLSPLIGRKHEVLDSLQYIVRLMTAKTLAEHPNIIVDIQGSRQRREQSLRQLARRMADQAVERKRTMALEPMPPSERRIIHMELRNDTRVRTASEGEGMRRKVTIIPA